MDKRTCILSVLAFASLCCAPKPSNEIAVRQPLMDALWQVESGGRENPPDGDGGKAIGPYQIWKPYWQDAIEYDSSIGGAYEDCRKREYAERVVNAYMRRYVPKDKWTDERIARVHNAGPNGWKKQASVKYWEKVKKHLK